MLTMLLLDMISKFLAAICIKVTIAFDVLTHLYACVLCNIQKMQFYRFYSVTTSQKYEKEKKGDLECPKNLEKKI